MADDASAGSAGFYRIPEQARAVLVTRRSINAGSLPRFAPNPSANAAEEIGGPAPVTLLPIDSSGEGPGGVGHAQPRAKPSVPSPFRSEVLVIAPGCDIRCAAGAEFHAEFVGGT